ncbi:D-alanyl-D-alanine carboxypeptidase [Actinoplanes cyaneus]|uniref:D-alanyl-D-alanine carboxypeptidase n=1 Tax=Actinoplanes cyaneus TaxID=52696 RepID=A0A919IJ23_9ACTN|nr:D-alanyl-D-alanine carboxypeptidase (penicillin-binding protein 5/6) [Actinoplanes cyaneus]GID66031.1 D-alanyl-D-alanine carboxypeptidase [Actinoplanes cyaneus]
MTAPRPAVVPAAPSPATAPGATASRSGAALVVVLLAAASAVFPGSPAQAAEIPCPHPRIAKPSAPPRPVPPADNPDDLKVGGDDLATHGLIVPPGAKQPPAVTATTWIVADLDTGEVLGSCGPHVHQTPASVQKTLLAATAIDKLDPKQNVKIVQSDLDIEVNSSAVGIVPGGTYPVSTLWLGLLLNSGNDAANALARMAGGGGADGVAKTVAAMNAKARELGAFQTHAVTPSGLDGKGQFTSAYDLALIARVDFANADFRKYVLTKIAQMPAQPARKVGGFQFQNENKLIYNYPGAMGGKTGFTTVARHSYVGAAQRNGRRLVVTLLGAEARPIRGWQQGAALLDWGFAQPAGSSVGHLVTPAEVAASAQATSAAPEKASTGGGAGVAAKPASKAGGLSVLAAVTAAVVLAGIPLLLLLVQRRRRRIARNQSS